MSQDYREKIRKLLQLADSPNEHEAKAALLKARELMAEHKLTEEDLKAIDRKVTTVITKWTCTKRNRPWLVHLASVIGENHCCKAITRHEYLKQTRLIGFVGFPDDIALCTEIYDYAAQFLIDKTDDIEERFPELTQTELVQVIDSYGYGFVVGLDQLYNSQRAQKEQDQEQWGLVMVTPKEVEDAIAGMRAEPFHGKTENNILPGAFDVGKEDGKNFNTGRILRGTEEQA